MTSPRLSSVTQLGKARKVSTDASDMAGRFCARVSGEARSTEVSQAMFASRLLCSLEGRRVQGLRL